MLSREHIDLCVDHGLCCHCGKAIQWGVDAVYSINGAHYDCQFPNGNPASQFEPLRSRALLEPALARKPDIGFGVATQPALARANGGHVLHWVVPVTGAAMCGHQPKNNSSRMRNRGKWLPLPDGADVTRRAICGSCAAKHAHQYPDLQLGAFQDENTG